MLGRREFMSAGAACAAALALGPGAALAGAAREDLWAEEFNRALRDDPQWLGWRSVGADRIESRVRVEGQLPEELRGAFYRNGPAVHDRFGLRYQHWFEGDGMLQEYRFDGLAVTHRAQVLETPKFRRERAAGRRLLGAFATPIPDGEPVRRPDDVNVANTAVLDHHGALYALWEGGSASRIDRETLAWSGFRNWGDGLQGLPFTAHPKAEADGTLWAFGYQLGRSPLLVLYHIAPDGRPVKVAPVQVSPLGMVHDFVVTDRHLVLVLPPYVVDPGLGAASFLGGHAWRPELGSRVLVVAKDDFEERRWFHLPAGFGFHHGNGWEEADGTIRFDHCLAPDPTVLRDQFCGFMRGRLEPSSQPRYTNVVLRPDGSATTEVAGGIAEFPRIAPVRTGRRNRFVYTLGGDGARSGYPLHQVVKRDLERGAEELHDYGTGVFAEEHVFVPRPGGAGEDDGWLVGTILDYRRGATAVAVLDARRPADGPVAMAWLDQPLPLGFHGWFSPA